MQVKEKLYPNAVFGNKPNILEAIHQKENSIAIYQRDITTLKDDISMAMQKEIAFKTSGSVSEIASKLKDFFAELLPKRHALFNDIDEALNQFDKVANASSYHLLLSTVNSNMCRKFHTDINDLRLLCTYAGPGTLWVTEEYSIKEKKKTNKELIIDEAQVHQADSGDILILKGALHPEGNPVVHRSPTIVEVGGKRLSKRPCRRLLLRLDTNDFLNFD